MMRRPELDHILNTMLDSQPEVSDLLFTVDRPLQVESFGELDCSRGILGHLRGPDLMPVLLNAADRPLYLGSRPTPFSGADGYPAKLEPLVL